MVSKSSSSIPHSAEEEGQEEKQRNNRALGTLLGACIGDSCGAFFEKLGRAPTVHEVEVSNLQATAA